MEQVGLEELLKQELFKGFTIGDLREYFYEQERKKVKEMIKKWLSWQEKERDLFSMEEVKTFESIIEMNSMDEINKAFALLDHENLEKKIDTYRSKKKEEEFYGVTLQEFQETFKTLLCQPKKEEFFSAEDIKKMEDVQKMGSLSECLKIISLQDIDILNEKMLSHQLQDTKTRMDKLVQINEEKMDEQREKIQELKKEIKESNYDPSLQEMLLETVEKSEKGVKLQELLNEAMKKYTRGHLASREKLRTKLLERIQNNT